MSKKTFEEALTQLEALTAELESGHVHLDGAIKKFDEGMKLVNFCTKQLAEAQKKVDILLKKDDGTLTAIPFKESAYQQDE